MIHGDELNVMCCSVCRGNLRFDGTTLDSYVHEGVLMCTSCLHGFTVTDGVPDFLTPDVERENEYQFWLNKLELLPLIRHQIATSQQNRDPHVDLDLVARELGPRLGSRLLEIGGGDCALGSVLHSSIEYWNIDPVHAQEAPIRAYRFVIGNGENLPFVDEAFDYVLIKDTIDYFYDLRSLFTNVHRVMRAEGRLLVTNKGRYGRNRLYYRARKFMRRLANHLKGALDWQDTYFATYSSIEMTRAVADSGLLVNETSYDRNHLRLFIDCSKATSSN